jgi:hypothetical protein
VVSQVPKQVPVQLPSQAVGTTSFSAVFAIIGVILPKLAIANIGKTAFAALLKNSLREKISSFLFFSSIK